MPYWGEGKIENAHGTMGRGIPIPGGGGGGGGGTQRGGGGGER